jgi:hypothetical protein
MTLKYSFEQAISLDPSVRLASSRSLLQPRNGRRRVDGGGGYGERYSRTLSFFPSFVVVTHTPSVLDYEDKSIEFFFAE